MGRTDDTDQLYSARTRPSTAAVRLGPDPSNTADTVGLIRSPQPGAYEFADRGHPEDRFGAFPDPVEGDDVDMTAVWAAYVQEASAFDQERFTRWSQRLDVQLLFNGLYVAVTVPLLTETSNLLKVDEPTRAAYVTNTALAVGTILSVTSATLCLHCKHWLEGYKAEGLFRGATERAESIQQASRLRQYRHEGLQKFLLPYILDAIPLLIYYSLVCFAVGLVGFLWGLARFIAFIVLGLCLVVLLMHFTTTIVQCFNPQAPYRTPLASFLYRVRHRMSAPKGQSRPRSLEEREMQDIRAKEAELDSKAVQWLKRNGRWAHTRQMGAAAEARFASSEKLGYEGDILSGSTCV
ncbi:hypothetical protein BD626DRAFT_263408 [Schizophyllum amplum]|uniref:DUF6535 domain-containing protein n=1 Tax=Schizophyllum amplum TaxID=97359 RepID=A0A550CGM4_9AGAR|nr:hypothetical protein BD626DRAFT_263408 [Auriculariopsis ampla]